MGGQSGQMPTQVLADQLTLSEPEGHIVPPTLLLAHPDLDSFLHPSWAKRPSEILVTMNRIVYPLDSQFCHALQH